MKKKITYTILTITTITLIYQTFLSASRKILIWVPYFVIGRGINKNYRQVLADKVLEVFDKSGSISTATEADRKRLLRQMEKLQRSASSCRAEESCLRKIGQQLQVDYILDGKVLKVGKEYVITIRMVKMLGELDVPTLVERVDDKKILVPMVEYMAKVVANNFRLRSSVYR